MKLHEFQPGKVVVGVFLIGAAVAFGGDARGLWDVPWFAMVPIVVSGFGLAAVASVVTYVIRHARGRSTAPRPPGPPPPSPGLRQEGPGRQDGPGGRDAHHGTDSTVA